jgi:hypothetical protein
VQAEEQLVRHEETEGQVQIG